MVLAGTKRRELLEQERPLRNAVSRERLAIDFFRTGYLSFSCSISGDRRGLKLDAFFLSVFPSPDCHDRSACLFSYPYDSLETCRATQSRLEFRFKRAGGSGAVKQPTYLVFQSREAQLIREAVWYLKYGTYREVSTRERAVKVAQGAASALAPTSATDPSIANASHSEVTVAQRSRALTCFADEEALNQRIDSRCRMIGCQRQCELTTSFKSSSSSLSDLSAPNVMLANNTPASHENLQATSSTTATSTRAASSTTIRAGLGCLCDEHAAMLCGSPPKGPSKLKRGGSSGFFSHKERSSRTIAHAMVSLVQAGHFARTLKYHGTLLKKPGSGGGSNKYQVKKAWNHKVVVVIETPVGGFLCYYDKLSHCPGMTDTPKERRVIDLSSVLCIRAESLFGGACASTSGAATNGTGGQSAGNYAFDIITLYRTWTFAATDAKEYETWLHVLTELVEKHAAAAPDKPLRYPVRIALPTGANRSTTRTEEAVLEISAHGLCVVNATSSSGNTNGVVSGANDGGDQTLLAWYFTDIQKWSVVAHQGEQCCLLSCLSVEKEATTSDQRPPLSSALSTPALPTAPRTSGTSSGSGRCDSFLLQTAEAGAICDVIEFYVGKCMAKVEVLTIEYMERYAKERGMNSAEIDSGVRRTPSMTSMLAAAQREAVERSKSEQIVSKSTVSGDDGPSVPLAKLYASGPKTKEVAATKEHALRAVSLAPIAAHDVLPSTLSKIQASIQTTNASPTSLANSSAPASSDSPMEPANGVPELNESSMARYGISRRTVTATPRNDEPSSDHEPAAAIRNETSSQVTEPEAARSEVALNRGVVSKEFVGHLSAEDASLALPIELDMIECVLVDDVNGPPADSSSDSDALYAASTHDASASSESHNDADHREQDTNDDEDEEDGVEPGLFPVDDPETDVPFLESSSSQSELLLDECDAESLVKIDVLDLSCLTSEQREMGGAREDNDGVSDRDAAIDDGEEEELDCFESFDYCICHVDGAAAPAAADSPDNRSHT